MAFQAGPLLDQIAFDLDDEVRTRTSSPDIYLHALSRAQEWVALRFRLLRATFPLPILAQVPVYEVAQASPRLVSVTHVALAGVPLWPQPLRTLRFRGITWPATTGTPTHFYRIGLWYLGVFPAPLVDAVAHVTGVIAPPPLTHVRDQLVIPDSYIPQVRQVATGLLLIASEKASQTGLVRIQAALAITPREERPQEEHAHATT